MEIEWLVGNTDVESTVELDVNEITDKQMEALETALKIGYYETPHQADLAELAEALQISKLAVSQRLNAAETKLVESLLDK